jgi:HAD superfamily hydrolase (TIGR01509 family)
VVNADRVEAVLFDNDGVLVDTEAAFFEVTREAFAGEGVILTPRHWARTYLGEGRTSRDIAKSLGVPGKRIGAMVDERNRVWRKRMEAGVPLRPGVLETLEALHKKVRMAVVTGSPREQFDLVHRFSGLLDFFEAVLTEDDFERSKPHPDAYLAALQRLGLPTDRCLAVEDSPRGLASATSAGLLCVLVPTELTDLEMCGDAAWVAADISGVVPVVLKETGLE